MEQPFGAKRPRWWHSTVLWGLLLSLALGAVSVLVDTGGPDIRLGAVLALIGIALTLAIEIFLRVEAVVRHQRSLDSSMRQYSAFATASPSCRAFITEIVDDWNAIEARGSIIHEKIREDLQAAFVSRISELRSGSVLVGPTVRHKFRSMPLVGFRTLHSLSATNPGYWESPPGQRYLTHQRDAIAAGTLTASRILVLDRAEVTSAADIVRDQLSAGIDLTIVIREDVVAPDDIARLHDLSLVVDDGGVKGVFIPGDNGETFSIVTDKVAEATFTLAQIKAYAKPAPHFYPDLPPRALRVPAQR